MLEKRYNSFYNRNTEFNENAVVISEAKETNYKYMYEIRLNTNHRLFLYVNKNIILKYGDYIKIIGEYVVPSTQRNYKGFNYKEFLKSKKIYGIVNANEITVLEENKIKGIYKFANIVKGTIKNKIIDSFYDKTANILIGILIGDTNYISIEEKEMFRRANLAHILAVSRNTYKFYYNNICIYF